MRWRRVDFTGSRYLVTEIFGNRDSHACAGQRHLAARLTLFILGQKLNRHNIKVHQKEHGPDLNLGTTDAVSSASPFIKNTRTCIIKRRHAAHSHSSMMEAIRTRSGYSYIQPNTLCTH